VTDKVTLTNEQIDDLISQFVQLKVDRMSHKDLEEHVKQDLNDYYNDWSIDELETIIDSELFEELVDNVTNEIAQPKVTITPQELEGDISTVTDDDYADKVDTLVGNMVASDDNVYTHDSEGC